MVPILKGIHSELCVLPIAVLKEELFHQSGVGTVTEPGIRFCHISFLRGLERGEIVSMGTLRVTNVSLRVNIL